MVNYFFGEIWPWLAKYSQIHGLIVRLKKAAKIFLTTHREKISFVSSVHSVVKY